MTGRLDMLEARQGFADTQSALPDRPIRWDGYQLDGNSFKFHAACFGVQGTIEAIAALRREGLRPEQVAAIRLTVNRSADRMCNIAAPRTGAEAKFSLRFAAALALDGRDTADPAEAETALRRKFEALLRPLMPDAQIDRLAAEIETLDRADDIGAILAAATPGRPQATP